MHSVDGALRFGEPLASARAAVVLLHGRGSSAEMVAGIARHFPKDAGLAYLAPKATGNTWYPQRFFLPLEQNEPWLGSALGVIEKLVDEAGAAGIPAERVAIVGFSQGACLALESAARRPRRYFFIGGLSGGLIGPGDAQRPAGGNLAGTPVLLGCAEEDAHIPIEYVELSADVLARMGAAVTKQIYPGGAHTLFPEEIEWMRQRIGELR